MRGYRALLSLALTALLAGPVSIRAQTERIADFTTEGWRRSAHIDFVRPPSQAAELQFATPEAIKTTPRYAELDRMADMRLSQPGTRAALMSEKRLVLIEKYLAGKASAQSTPIGNSISKSLVSMAVGKALCDGSIKSLEDPVSSYVPGLSGTSWGNASVRNLLRMASGAFRSDATSSSGFKNQQDTVTNRAIYSKELQLNYIDMMKLLDDRVAPPGLEFNYSNHDTNALVLTVEAATQQSFAKYFEKTIWSEVKAEKDGAWVKNSQGQVAGYFGFSASPRDWLRLGHYVLDELKRPGCFSSYLQEATRRQIAANWTFMKSYGYQIWTHCTLKSGSFCFLGYGGQQLVMHPASDTVLYVHGTTNESAFPWRQLFDRF